MKKRVASLLLALVMALCLFPTALAAEGPVQISGLAQGQTGFFAGYDDQGRMVGARMLTADGEAPAIPGATSWRLFQVDDTLAPQAPAFSPVADKGTVRKVDGQVCVCYTSPEGLTLTQPVRSKVTGSVSSLDSNDQLRINGVKYPATELTVEGCAYPISAGGLRSFFFENGDPYTTFDFYLDQSGAICWIDQQEDGPHRVCVVLAAWHDASGLQADILTDGKTVKTIPVTRLDGQAVGDGADCISPADALAQLEADCEKAFYTYSRLASGGYHLVRAGKDSPVDTGFAWGDGYVIPAKSPTQPDADFTFDTVPCQADERTVCWVAAGDPGEKTYFYYRGFQRLPSAQGSGCVITRPDGVADLVYLDIPFFITAPPTGYVMVINKGVVFSGTDKLINILDDCGNKTTLRVSESIAQAILHDSMSLDRFADNTYVGKLCRVIALDQDGTALSMEPVETMDVRDMGDSVVSLSDGTSYAYDSATEFICADLGWEDMDGDDVRGDADRMRLVNCGAFDPKGFFHAADVSTDPDDETWLRSVRAAVIPAQEDPDLAGYVYVVRELW